MPIRVIATDIDHTLIDERGHLPAINIEALQSAYQRGCHIVLATARRREPTLEIAQKLQIPVAMVCHNGARVWDDRDQEVSHHTLDHTITTQIAEVADHTGLAFMFTIDEMNFYNAKSAISTSASNKVHTPIPALRLVCGQPTTRIVAQGNEAAEVLWTMLNNNPNVQCFRYMNNDGVAYSTVAAHPLATKEEALISLCKRWNVQRQQVLAIGDSDADVGMLRWAGLGVSLKGSMPNALTVAQWVAPSARLGGVAVAIHRYVLDQEQRT